MSCILVAADCKESTWLYVWVKPIVLTVKRGLEEEQRRQEQQVGGSHGNPGRPDKGCSKGTLGRKEGEAAGCRGGLCRVWSLPAAAQHVE